MGFPLTGTWVGSIQPFGVLHKFTRKVEQTNDENAAATLTLVRYADGDPTLVFNVHTCLTRRFLAPLSEDKSKRGVNAMVLELMEDANRLKGRIIWNSRTRNTVYESSIEFKRMF